MKAAIIGTGGAVCGVIAFLAIPSRMCQAVTLRTNTQFVSFSSANMTNYDSGFDYSSAGGADMAIDQAGNLHIVSSEGDVNHRGTVFYRRWTQATNGWSGPVLTFEGSVSDAYSDNWHALVTVDDADRVHVLYHHRVSATTSGGTEPYDLYHLWCTNASGTTPLTTNNWIKTKITTIPSNTLVKGSLISVSNVLFYARGWVDVNADGQYDIRIDRADWNGSSWVWCPVGATGAIITNATKSFLNPQLTYDRLNNVLHMSYRDQSYPRLQVYAASSQPTNPIPSTWTTPVNQGAISPANYEGNGGTGILEDGRAVTAVYLGANQDGMGANVTNFTRIRSAGYAGTWSAWKVAFSNDVRSLGANGGYPTPSAFAPDGAGGLFMVTGNQYVDHWDPKTETWADVFTNLPAGPDGVAIANIGVYVQSYPKPTRIYHYRRENRKLYVGDYYVLRQPKGTVITLQ